MRYGFLTIVMVGVFGTHAKNGARRTRHSSLESIRVSTCASCSWQKCYGVPTVYATTYASDINQLLEILTRNNALILRLCNGHPHLVMTMTCWRMDDDTTIVLVAGSQRTFFGRCVPWSSIVGKTFNFRLGESSVTTFHWLTALAVFKL